MIARPSSAAWLLAALCTTTVAAAQPVVVDDTRPRIGMFHVTMGGSALQAGALDARLRAAGLPGVASSTASVGSGAHVLVGRLVLGATGQLFIGGERTDARWSSRVGGGQGLLDAGVALVARPGAVVALVGGVGASRVTTRIRPVDGAPFDSLLGRPSRSVSLAASTPLVHVGLVADRRIVLQRGRPMLVGLRVGWVGRAGASRWRGDDLAAAGGPNAAPGGLTVSLTVGATFRKRHDAILPVLGATLPWLPR